MIINHKFGKFGKFIKKRNWAAVTNGGILSFLHEHNCCLVSKRKKHLLRKANVLRPRNTS